MPIFDLKDDGFFSSQVHRSRIFRRVPGERTSGGLTVVCGGCEHCALDYEIDRKGFPYWCLEFVAAGSGEVTMGRGKPVALRPGSIFVYGPATAYRMRSDDRQPLVKYFVDFTGPSAGRVLKENGFEPGSTTLVFPPGPVAESFDRLIDAGLDSAPRASRRTALLLEALVLGCADLRVPQQVSDSGAFAAYQRCRMIIDGLDPAGPAIRSVTQTARLCGVSSAYLCRLFRRFTDDLPYRYLARRRIIAATARLSRPNSLVKEVAEEFGFADAYHFSRVFKRLQGLSPAAFLRQRTGH